MQRTLKITIVSFLFAISPAYGESPTTFIGPTLQGNYTGWFSSASAFSILGEAGYKNYRINLTAGTKIDETQRLKFSAEYLWQKLGYHFESGHVNKWVEQLAAGAAYRYVVGCDDSHALSIGAYVSHAPSKNLSTRYLYNEALDLSIPDYRRIAGSNAWGVNPGIDFSLWEGGRIGLYLNYDDVRYQKTFVPQEEARGIGGTLTLQQRLGDHLRVGGSLSDRKAYDHAEANINYDDINYWSGRWSLGAFGAYTRGKVELVNSWNIGLSVNYFADCFITPVANYKNEEITPVAYDPEFLAWVTDPAVYMPQVLAIADEHIPAVCNTPPPTVLSVIPDTLVTTIEDIPTASHFSGSGLTYSLAFTPALEIGDTLEINPTTGVILAESNNEGEHSYLVTVTATNRCGSASTTFTVFMGRND